MEESKGPSVVKVTPSLFYERLLSEGYGMHLKVVELFDGQRDKNLVILSLYSIYNERLI
jgi:hypothetical protein